MAKTTNILDLNNRLEKVEKENVAQNSYTSLKNKPKINSHILTGDKSSADLGLAAAGDITDINTAIGDMTQLQTTATDLVGAINEVNDKLNKSYGAVVDISSYDTSTNTYTVPNDGMVILAVNDVTTGAEVSLMDADANLNMGMSIGNGAIQLVNSIMVIKGQHIYGKKMNASNAAIYYRPIN